MNIIYFRHHSSNCRQLASTTVQEKSYVCSPPPHLRRATVLPQTAAAHVRQSYDTVLLNGLNFYSEGLTAWYFYTGQREGLPCPIPESRGLRMEWTPFGSENNSGWAVFGECRAYYRPGLRDSDSIFSAGCGEIRGDVWTRHLVASMFNSLFLGIG